MAAALVAVMGMGTIGVASTFAAAPLDSANRFAGLQEAIAQRFHVDVADVQQVFQEQHARMQDEMRAQSQERLDALVADGKLTQEQVDALQAKHQEMEALQKSLKDATPQERKDAIESHREDMKAFADELGLPNIPLEGMRAREGRGGMGRPHQFKAPINN